MKEKPEFDLFGPAYHESHKARVPHQHVGRPGSCSPGGIRRHLDLSPDRSQMEQEVWGRLLPEHMLRRMAFLSKFVRGALAGLATAGIGGCPSRRGSDEKASG